MTVAHISVRVRVYVCVCVYVSVRTVGEGEREEQAKKSEKRYGKVRHKKKGYDVGGLVFLRIFPLTLGRDWIEQ